MFLNGLMTGCLPTIFMIRFMGAFSRQCSGLSNADNWPIQVTLKSFFTDSDDFQSDGAESYLSELADGVISITQSPDYAKIIHEAHVRRQLVLIGDEVILDASHPEVDVPAHQQIETAESKLFRLADTDSTSVGLRGFDSVISGSITQADLARKSDGHLSGTSTGLTDLNNLLGGLHKSDLIILAGRPGMGKTALATNIAFHAAGHNANR
jgi:replicative DNA helicase